MGSLMALTQHAYTAHRLSIENLAPDTGGTAKILAAVAVRETRFVAVHAGVLSLCSACVCVAQIEFKVDPLRL